MHPIIQLEVRVEDSKCMQGLRPLSSVPQAAYADRSIVEIMHFLYITIILETWSLYFGYLGHHGGDPGIQGFTVQAPGGLGVHF